MVTGLPCDATDPAEIRDYFSKAGRLVLSLSLSLSLSLTEEKESGVSSLTLFRSPSPPEMMGRAGCPSPSAKFQEKVSWDERPVASPR